MRHFSVRSLARRFAVALTLGVVAVALMAVPAVARTAGQADDEPIEPTRTEEPRTITVSATGDVRGIPDVMELTIGVQSREESAGEALLRNSERAAKVIQVLRDAGVDEKDIQTSSLYVSPVYDDEGEHVIAYSVSNTVEARIKALDEVGKVVDAATSVAGNDIVVRGLSFSFDDNTELVTQARTTAVKRARTQAEQLAAAAGVELGNLLTMTEDSTPYGPVVDAAPRGASESAADAAPPVEPGSQALSVTVTMIYEIR
jgi:uncharacterized protein YggE